MVGSFTLVLPDVASDLSNCASLYFGYPGRRSPAGLSCGRNQCSGTGYGFVGSSKSKTRSSRLAERGRVAGGSSLCARAMLTRPMAAIAAASMAQTGQRCNVLRRRAECALLPKVIPHYRLLACGACESGPGGTGFSARGLVSPRGTGLPAHGFVPRGLRIVVRCGSIAGSCHPPRTKPGRTQPKGHFRRFPMPSPRSRPARRQRERPGRSTSRFVCAGAFGCFRIGR